MAILIQDNEFQILYTQKTSIPDVEQQWGCFCCIFTKNQLITLKDLMATLVQGNKFQILFI